MSADAQWQRVLTGVAVPARPEGGYWTVVLPFVSAGTLVRIETAREGRWKYAGDRECGPDGDAVSYVNARSCLNASGPVGALVGKIGGSTADTEGQAFVVGRHCVVKVAKDKEGVLFLAMNDTRAGFGDNHGELRVDVWTMAGSEAPSG